jgi:hypothetical protein
MQISVSVGVFQAILVSSSIWLIRSDDRHTVYNLPYPKVPVSLGGELASLFEKERAKRPPFSISRSPHKRDEFIDYRNPGGR